MPTVEPARRVRFGPFEADLRSGELRREGARVKLQEQPFQVLALLLERPGELVSREDLRSRLWPADTFVDFDHGLNTAIKKLRQALDDSAESPLFIETLARRGYRLIGQVAPSPPSPIDEPVVTVRPDPLGSPRWPSARKVALGALVCLVLGGGYFVRTRLALPSGPAGAPVVLAVLPFHVTAGPGSQESLGLGLADDLITHLANVPSLRVRPTRSVLPYQGPTVDVRQAGRELEVESILSGTVRELGARYRVSVQIVRVADGASYWGESFDVTREELPGLSNRITQEVTAALGLRPAAAEQSPSYRRYTENAAAYEAYLRGRAHLVRTTQLGTTAAVEAFEEALRLDPSYALAYAGLSMASADMHLRFAPAPEVAAWGERAKDAAHRALALHANLAEAHLGLAAVYGKTEFEWERVIEESRRALALNPRLELPHSYLGRAFYHLGLLEAAEKEARAALALDPENRTEPLRTLGITLLLAGRPGEAVPFLEEVQRMSGKPLSDYYLAQAYYYHGETSRAEAILEELSGASAASNSSRARATLASFLAARGERSRAEALLREVAGVDYMDHHIAYSLGAARAQLGHAKEAVAWLRRAAETGFPCHAWYARDPLLSPLRADSEIEQLMQDLERAQAAAQSRYLR